MSLQDISAYLVELFRKGPEVIAAFFVGCVFTILMLVSLRRWLGADQDLRHELVRKELELSRKDAELARKEEELRRSSRGDSIPSFQLDLLPQHASLQNHNSRLVEENERLKKDLANLRQQIAIVNEELAHSKRQVEELSDELSHAMKWLDRAHEENSQLAENNLQGAGVVEGIGRK